MEAYSRMQGKEKPVRDYIFGLLTILRKLEEPWAEKKQRDILHQNMLPALQ